MCTYLVFVYIQLMDVPVLRMHEFQWRSCKTFFDRHSYVFVVKFQLQHFDDFPDLDRDAAVDERHQVPRHALRDVFGAVHDTEERQGSAL